MTELLIATKKGLFVLEGDAGGPFTQTARAFAGEPVEYATRVGERLLASVTSAFHGPKIWHGADAGGAWQQARGVALPEGGDAALERIWLIVAGAGDAPVLYAGGDPGVLFESRDGGLSWALNEALWEHPTRPAWQPGGGGLCLHSIVPWPGDPQRLTVAVSAAGVWHTDDGGASWSRGNAGLVAGYAPEASRADTTDLCVHHLERAPRRPERLFMQFHGGVYRSDDGGRSWIDVAPGLPSSFGFPLAVDPADPDSAFVIPLTADVDRTMPDGRVRVYATRDGGASWTALGDGLPSEHAYVTVLRLAFDACGEGEALQLYFGTTSGELYGSADAGASWHEVATHLPPVHGVTAIA